MRVTGRHRKQPYPYVAEWGRYSGSLWRTLAELGVEVGGGSLPPTDYRLSLQLPDVGPGLHGRRLKGQPAV
jgi:hypothetical protein